MQAFDRVRMRGFVRDDHESATGREVWRMRWPQVYQEDRPHPWSMGQGASCFTGAQRDSLCSRGDDPRWRQDEKVVCERETPLECCLKVAIEVLPAERTPGR